MYRPTQRSYSNANTGEIFTMYQNDTTKDLKLISNKTQQEQKAFILAAFNAITYKLKDGKIIELQTGEFLPVDKNNPPTHKKFTGLQKRFTKI